MRILGVIPARFASSRFPGKPLINIKGSSMISRVYSQVLISGKLLDVVVATDDQRIYNHVEAFGGKAVMTSEKHLSGTDRCFETLQILGNSYDFILNIQGDEPFIKPEQINLLIGSLSSETEIATLIKSITEIETLENINSPKVIFNKNFEAIYFSRYPIPYTRNYYNNSEKLQAFQFYKHIGIYAYRSDILEKIAALSPSGLENAESLEQLRWIENGYRIKVAITPFETFGIDCPEDLLKIEEFLSNEY